MIPNTPWIVCTADIDHKDKYYLPGVEQPIILMNEWNENNRVRNPNIAKVKYIPYQHKIQGYNYLQYWDQVLKPGDDVYVQHFQLRDHEYKSMSTWNDKDGTPLFFVNFNEIYFKFDGAKPTLLSDFVLAERIPDKHNGVILTSPKPERKAIIRYVAPGVSFVKPGDTILYMPWADYELTFNGIEYIKMREDEIFGAFNMGGIEIIPGNE